MIYDSQGYFELGNEEAQKCYIVRVFCSNCGFNSLVYITKGESVEKQNCINCDCVTLSYYNKNKLK